MAGHYHLNLVERPSYSHMVIHSNKQSEGCLFDSLTRALYEFSSREHQEIASLYRKLQLLLGVFNSLGNMTMRYAKDLAPEE